MLVFDSGHGRSTHHQVNHNYLGFPDGVATVHLRELAREQLGRYHRAHVLHRTITRIDGDAYRGFTAHAQGHEWHARSVVLATGVLDHFPHERTIKYNPRRRGTRRRGFPGWESYVGRSMFWCITCDGYENRGRHILVVGHTDAAAGEAMQLHTRPS